MAVRPTRLGIWVHAFGYFACYAPYAALTKAVSTGMLPGLARPIDGFELLPITTLASSVGMIAFLSAMGWWRYAGARSFFGMRVPFPGRWTLLSGLCTACIVGTTTLAYTFSGVSIVFMMLLMRGGLLVVAPIVDLLSGRTVRWFSGVALVLSLGALAVATFDRASYDLTGVALIDVLVYLASYVVRLRFMSRLAKSNDRATTLRYFVEEQMVATPVIVLTLGLVAVIGHGHVMLAVRRGFVAPSSAVAVASGIVIGLLSQGTGIFGGLILLDARENSFCVPVNRASSVLAGVLASFSLAAFLGGSAVPARERLGASLIFAAIVVLAWPTVTERILGIRRTKSAAPSEPNSGSAGSDRKVTK